FAGFVSRPYLVAERLDDVIGRHADVGLSGFENLQHALQHTDYCAERPILTLGKAAQTVEMSEQLVGTVDEMNDHAAALCREAQARAQYQAATVRLARVRWHTHEPPRVI